MRRKRRAEEDAGALLGDDHVAELRLELGPDRVVLEILRVGRRLVARTAVGRLVERVSLVE